MASSVQPLLPGKPFAGKKQLYNVIEAQLSLSFVRHLYDAQELKLRPGDHIIVETGTGPVLARTTGHSRRQLLKADSLLPVLRQASQTDIDMAADIAEKEKEAYRFGIQRVRARKLPMKLVRVQAMLDSSRMVFFFAAEGRVDFRDLVKDLAHHFRMRIEMHQIGIRDGTRMIGGIGSCGRELCCSTFLEKFAPVSIRMAKDQGLSLNPQKVSGMCGRLMCCLVYEQKTYKRLKRRLPKSGRMIDTAYGEAKVLSVDVLNQRVRVALPDASVRTLGINDIRRIQPDDVTPWQEKKVEYIWPEIMKALEETKRSPQRRRKRGRNPSKNPVNKDGQGQEQNRKKPKQEGTSAEGNQAGSSNRTRRRRRRKPQSERQGQGEDQGQNQGQDQASRSRPNEKKQETNEGGASKAPPGEPGTAPRRRRRRRRKPNQGGDGKPNQGGDGKPNQGGDGKKNEPSTKPGSGSDGSKGQ
jgi:cell fate regulator YaaT (PSP1 superfamily)